MNGSRTRSFISLQKKRYSSFLGESCVTSLFNDFMWWLWLLNSSVVPFCPMDKSPNVKSRFIWKYYKIRYTRYFGKKFGISFGCVQTHKQCTYQSLLNLIQIVKSTFQYNYDQVNKKFHLFASSLKNRQNWGVIFCIYFAIFVC